MRHPVIDGGFIELEIFADVAHNRVENLVLDSLGVGFIRVLVRPVPPVLHASVHGPVKDLVHSHAHRADDGEFPVAHSAASWSALYGADSKRQHSANQRRGTVHVGPLRCFAMMSSAVPFLSVSFS